MSERETPVGKLANCQYFDEIFYSTKSVPGSTGSYSRELPQNAKYGSELSCISIITVSNERSRPDNNESTTT